MLLFFCSVVLLVGKPLNELFVNPFCRAVYLMLGVRVAIVTLMDNHAHANSANTTTRAHPSHPYIHQAPRRLEPFHHPASGLGWSAPTATLLFA